MLGSPISIVTTEASVRSVGSREIRRDFVRRVILRIADYIAKWNTIDDQQVQLWADDVGELLLTKHRRSDLIKVDGKAEFAP